MEDVALLLLQNADFLYDKVEISDCCFIFRQRNRVIDAHALASVIRFINTILNVYAGIKLPVIFKIGQAKFADKLIYIIFECLCDYLIENRGYKVKVDFAPQAQIHTAGIKSSPLLLLSTGREDHIEKFKQKFKFEIFRNHYRRALEKKDLQRPDFLCKIMDDVAWFQEPYNVDRDCREAISEVIIELVGNASEHGGSNCLIDFDVAPSYFKVGSNKEYVGINIAIVNFSTQLLGTALKNKIINYDCQDERYCVVRKAYRNHCNFFEQDYKEEDFFNITAFQHKISGRCDSITGGTGLTKLIESLEIRSDMHMCYVTSGKRTLAFKQRYLKYSDDGWLGFNASNDYLSSKPDVSVLSNNQFMMPGTAYNLNFVMEKENKNAENSITI